MNLKTNWWARVKFIMRFLLEWKRKTYPIAKIGQVLILVSIGQWSIFSPEIALSFFPDSWLSQISIDLSNKSIVHDIITVILIFFGLALIIFDIRNVQRKARTTAKVLVSGMSGTSTRFPNELLSWAEQNNSRELIELGVLDDGFNSIDSQVSKYNSEINSNMIKRFILHEDCNKLYLGGLARVPFLVAYGACFRAISAEVVYFDRFHREGDWKLLNDESESISFSEYDLDTLKPDSKGNIGLALGFSTAILKSQLPDFISGHTLILSPNIQLGRNLIKNQENLHLISGEVQNIIDRLSSLEGCEKVHLFLSVQSTLALDIGKRYQEGIHKNWIIHNYNGSLSEYDWAIELSKKGISKFKK